MTPHYPEIRVHVESQNSLTLVAAVRHALRQARVGKEEIYRFSEEAFARRGEYHLEAVCREWVHLAGPGLLEGGSWRPKPHANRPSARAFF